MAILSPDKTYVTVQRGDCLWNIARDYLGSGTKYPQLKAINGLKSNLIYPGQKIKLTGSATSSTSSSTANSNKAKITLFGLISDSTQNTLFAVWDWSKSNTDHFEYEWEYTIKDTKSTWWTGSKATTEDYECTYNIPSNAELVRFRVKPISKTYTKETKSGNTTKTTEVSYWTAEWTNFNGDGAYKPYNTSAIPPSPPSTPSVALDSTDKLKLTASIDNISASELNATHVQFQIVKNNVSEFELSGNVAINSSYNYVSYSNVKKLHPGGEYKVRARSVRGNLTSAWTDYSSSVSTAPSKPAKLKTCMAKSSSTDGKISVYLEWAAVPAATSYDIEYATNITYFNGTDQTETITGIELTHHETYSLETGHEYFFRIRAVNGSGKSDWSEISSVILGESPSAPTTWSSTTTATVGGPLTLYWVHNSKDGSSQTWAQLALEVYVANGLDVEGNINYVLQWSKTTEIKNTASFEDRDKTSSFDAASYLASEASTYYKDGIQLRWRVRTSGVTSTFGDWSIVRLVDIYAQPSVTLEVKDATNTINTTFDTVGSFPITISATTQPATQAPIGFYINIVSNDVYDTVDSVGNNKTVNVGDSVYSKYIDQTTDLENLVLSAGDVDLESSMNYTLVCIASMNSGLTAEASLNFTVSWEEVSYVPNASIAYDSALIVTHIHPYCNTRSENCYEVTYDSSTKVYTKTDTKVNMVSEEPVRNMYMADETQVFSEYVEDGLTIYYYLDQNGSRVEIDESLVTKTEDAYTSTGEQVYSGLTELSIDSEGNVTGGASKYFYKVVTETPVEGVTLAVYRREFDGSYTELGKDIDNLKNTYITDPHPALDYARYRIVATTQSTGAVSYYDVPAYPIGEKAIIIQWDEDWTTFDVQSDDPLSQPPWSGSLLRLPYNVDVSDNYDTDVSLVEYAGRKRPVSYYGTQLGETSTWNTVVAKSDEETIYALRRLAIWPGDVYVREPSGTGYWANVTVSFSQKHCDVTVPVTLSITRVEGGA